jgi:hypothetical protein
MLRFSIVYFLALFQICWVVLSHQTVLAAPSPIPESQAKLRGCDDGGLAGINRILPAWVSVESEDTPVMAEGLVLKSRGSRIDMPTYHSSHDWNFDLKLDPAYFGLYSEGNGVPEENDSAPNTEEAPADFEMDMEWEIKYFPAQFWPIVGDRVWMMGRWIFDCGHPPYRTEIHPPKAVAFTRLAPTIFKGDSAPSFTNQSFIYIHGLSGYYQSSVADRNYEFDLDLPEKPSENAEFKAQIQALPFGGPTPILRFMPEKNKLHILYPLALNDPNPELKFAAVIAAGWREPVLSQNYRKLRISIDSIRINQDHDPWSTGEWRLFIQAGNEWFEVPGLDAVDNGSIRTIAKVTEIILPEKGRLTLRTTGWENDCDSAFLTDYRHIHQFKNIFEVPMAAFQCIADQNDHIGRLNLAYSTAENFGIGSHDLASEQNHDSETKQDFNLRFRIEEVARFSAGLSLKNQQN